MVYITAPYRLLKYHFVGPVGPPDASLRSVNVKRVLYMLYIQMSRFPFQFHWNTDCTLNVEESSLAQSAQMMPFKQMWSVKCGL